MIPQSETATTKQKTLAGVEVPEIRKTEAKNPAMADRVPVNTSEALKKGCNMLILRSMELPANANV
jgi:hypothetical protein